MAVRAVALVPWAGIGAVVVQKLAACGEGAGEGVDGESVPVADGGHEGVDGVRPYGANERGLACSNQARTRNHEALLMIVEGDGTDGVRTSYVVAVVCGDQQCSHLLNQLYQRPLSLLDYSSWREISLACLMVKQNSDLTGFGFAEPHGHSGPP